MNNTWSNKLKDIFTSKWGKTSSNNRNWCSSRSRFSFNHNNTKYKCKYSNQAKYKRHQQIWNSGNKANQFSSNFRVLQFNSRVFKCQFNLHNFSLKYKLKMLRSKTNLKNSRTKNQHLAGNHFWQSRSCQPLSEFYKTVFARITDINIITIFQQSLQFLGFWGFGVGLGDWVGLGAGTKNL